MDCLECSNNLTAYLDRELLPHLEQEISSHLKTCVRCTKEFHELEAAAQFVEAHSHNLELSPDMWNNLRARVVPMPVPGQAGALSFLRAKNRWLSAAAAIAAAILLAVGVSSYIDHLEEQREIQQYMSDYISKREKEEQIARIRSNDLQSNETKATEFIELENPFGSTRSVSFQNPFR